jgi:cellulose synthase/poly-beta-1,6-N-acetylglucosamine synthase-like glycosyltransferase
MWKFADGMACVRLIDDAWAMAQRERRPSLSIIIPACNETRRLPRTLEQIQTYLKSQPCRSEIVIIVIVENRSTDGTVPVVKRAARGDSWVWLIRSPRRGKGLAITLDLLEARGRYRFHCDADLLAPILVPPRLTAMGRGRAVSCESSPLHDGGPARPPAQYRTARES